MHSVMNNLVSVPDQARENIWYCTCPASTISLISSKAGPLGAKKPQR